MNKEVNLLINVTVVTLDAAAIADLKLLRQRLTRPVNNPWTHQEGNLVESAPPITDSERDTDRQLAVVNKLLDAVEKSS